jgi:hypothetical protein
MKENIPALIAFCNRQIITWYKKEFPSELKMGEFTPVDKNNQDIIETIYQMYLVLKKDTKVQMLIPAIKYYFAVAVVEYYVLDCMCPLFVGTITTQMLEFSMNKELSLFRKKMMGFNNETYTTRTIQTPYILSIKINDKPYKKR